MNAKQKELLGQLEAKEKQRDVLLNGEFKSDTPDQVRGLNAEIKAIQEQFELINQAEESKAWGGRPASLPPLDGGDPNPETGNLGYTKAGHADLTFENGVLKELRQQGEGTYGIKTWEAINSNAYKQAFNEYLRKGEYKLGATALKDLQEGIDSQGGYLAPPEVLARIVSRQATPTRLGGLVTNLNTSRNAVVMPTVNYADSNNQYSTGFRVTYTGEAPSTDPIAVTDTNLFGEQRIEVYTAMMNTAIPRDLLEDSGLDLQGWLTGKLSETHDLEVDNMIINGTGVGQPLGIIGAITASSVMAPSAVVSGSSTTLLTPGLINLTEDLPEQYDTNARVVFAKTRAGKVIRGLLDGQNRPIFTNGWNDSGFAGPRNPLLNGC